jgi:hypothetical protein
MLVYLIIFYISNSALSRAKIRSALLRLYRDTRRGMVKKKTKQKGERRGAKKYCPFTRVPGAAGPVARGKRNPHRTYGI